jgi:hypothetical protein
VLLTVGTAFAAAGYIALVVVTGDLVGSQANSLWLSVLATAAIALAFQPLRRKVVRLADRLAYGGRAVPYEELAAFSRKLGESPDERRLLPAIAQAAALAVSAEHATAQLFVLDGSERLGCWPADAKSGDETVEFPVIDQGEQLGRIAVRMPPGRALRRADDALLVDLAAQTALAFRNAQLATELAGRVAQLDRRTEQLASSRARVIQARDAERFRLEMAIRREVISHLVDLPARLDAMSRSAQPPGPALGAMIEQSVDALEALRELTRGIYSTQLSQFGLASAVSAHVRRRSGNGAFTADATMRGRRFGQRTESAAYFCCVTAMRELAAPIAVDLAVRNDRLMVTMRSAPSPAGPDLVHLQDRLDPLAGTVAWLEAAERSILTITMPAQVGA